METMGFEEAFKGYGKNVLEYHKKFPKTLVGREIVDLEYGLDADGDSQLYYIVLDNGIKIGLARVYNEPDENSGVVEELDRTERYEDGSIIRFLFHNWPIEEKE